MRLAVILMQIVNQQDLPRFAGHCAIYTRRTITAAVPTTPKLSMRRTAEPRIAY